MRIKFAGGRASGGIVEMRPGNFPVVLKQDSRKAECVLVLCQGFTSSKVICLTGGLIYTIKTAKNMPLFRDSVTDLGVKSIEVVSTIRAGTHPAAVIIHPQLHILELRVEAVNAYARCGNPHRCRRPVDIKRTGSTLHYITLLISGKVSADTKARQYFDIQSAAIEPAAGFPIGNVRTRLSKPTGDVSRMISVPEIFVAPVDHHADIAKRIISHTFCQCG